MITATDPHYQVSVLVQDVDFERFVREALGIRSQVTGGHLAGEFTLRGAGADPALANARGEFRIAGAKLFQLPGFVQLLNTLGFKGDQTTFREAEIDILIHHNTYYFEKLLLKGYDPGREGRGPRIGIPYALFMHEQFPLWRAFFTSLGMDVVLSGRSKKETLRRGLEASVAESCFPIKVAN